MADYTNYPTVAISDLDSTEVVTLSNTLVVDQPDATRKATLSSVLSSLGVMRCIFFSKGGTLGSKKDIAIYEEDGKFYTWGGPYPKIVEAGSTPEESGGIGPGAWISNKDTPFVRVWKYRAVADGETTIQLPKDIPIVDVQTIYVQGLRQDLNEGFTYNAADSTIILADGLDVGDLVTVIIDVDPDSNKDIFAALKGTDGASNVGTSSGGSVQDVLDNLLLKNQQLTDKLASNNGASNIGTLDGITVEEALSNNAANIREHWRRQLSDAGLNLVDGSFEEGATVSTSTDAVWHIAVGQCYTWEGAFPKTVPADSAPTSTGGVGPGAWDSVGDTSLRRDLADDDGVDLVNGAVKDKDFELYKRLSFAKNRFNFAFGNKYSRSFNNNLRLQLQTYVENVFNFAPKTVSLPGGRLVTIYTVKDGANSDPGQDGTPMHIDFMISDDNGVNWTQAGTVVNKGVGYATSETVLFLNNNDGYLYCFFTSMKGITGWGHAQQGTNPDNTSTIEYCVSKDRGETWSEPVDITAAVKPAGAYFSSIAPTQVGYINGRPAIPYYYLTTISSGIVEGYITTDADGNYIYGEDVRKDTDTDTIGTSGGEIGFGNFYDGTPFAIERAADTTTKPYKIAIQKLLMQDSSGKWVVKGQFPTTNCMASFLRVGPDYGFDKDYLFVVAPVGPTGKFEGRANLRLFDCTNDFSNPQDKGLLSESVHVETGYSSTVLLSSGTFMSVWNGRQWTVNNSIYTVNRLTGSNIIPVPFCGSFKIVDTSKTYAPDIMVNEKVIGLSDGLMYRWNGSYFARENAATTSTVNSVVSTIDADAADLLYLDSGASGSAITKIIGGYVGKTIRILPLSSNTVVTLVKQASGVNVNERIMYNTSSGVTEYKTNGEFIQLTKTNYGWYLDRPANSA